jgi:hypothetical protein
MFAALTTPTPTAKPTTATKCSKPVHPLETLAKRPKPRERHTVTRSASKNALITQTGGDLDMDMDMINGGSETMVCPPYVTDTPLLTMACADQGQRYIVGSRPLVAVSWVIVNACDELGWTDQMGRDLIAETLTRKMLCHSHASKTMPSFIICIVVTLILLCSINSAAATATSAGSLSLFALNTNGFVHPMKIDATNRAISHRNPDIVVITETKTNSSGSSKISYNDYQFFEE